MRSTRRTLGAVLAAVLLLGLLAGPAAAHVHAVPDEVPEPTFDIDFRIEHGCEGAPTTAVRVQIPEEVEDALPQEVPGWEIELVQGGEGAGGEFTEVAWVGGSLPDGQTGDFGLSGVFSEGAGDVVYFPLVQECGDEAHRWIDIPETLDEWGQLEEPAPYVRLAFRDDGSGEEGPGTTGGGDDPGPGATATAPDAGEAETAADEPGDDATGGAAPTESGPTGAEPGDGQSTDGGGATADPVGGTGAGPTTDPSPVAEAGADGADGADGGMSPVAVAGVLVVLVALGAGVFAATRGGRG